MIQNTYHSMTRRATAHDYSRPGIYHITLHVAEGQGCPLGTVTGDPTAADGTSEAPRVELSPVGQMVEQELLYTLPSHYSMVTIDTYTLMPDHLHLLIKVIAPIVSNGGRSTHLGQVIAGFKKGCNKRFWEIIGYGGGETASHTVAAASVSGGFPASFPTAMPAGTYKVPSNASSGRPPLFAEGYCDVMPVDAEQLATQRAYIKGNPRSRLLRLSHRDLLTTQRGAVPTALTPAALTAYLRRECAPSQASPEALAAIAGQLLIRPGKPAGTPSADLEIVCDSYGDRSMLEKRLLPVVCHRRDKGRLAEQKRRCLEEAAVGAVLVSPRIAKGEQEIIDEAVCHGFPVVLLEDNGFPDRYHPSAERLDRCAAGRLLLLTPWRYRYRHKGEAITVAECKTQNCLTQSLCHQDDSWWEDNNC